MSSSLSFLTTVFATERFLAGGVYSSAFGDARGSGVGDD